MKKSKVYNIQGKSTNSFSNQAIWMALAAILRAVPVEKKSSIAEKNSAKEMWTAIKTIRLGDEHVCAANVQKLLGAFENVKFHDSESIDEFAMGLNLLASKPRALDEKTEEM
jgi:hypothetical protein